MACPACSLELGPIGPRRYEGIRAVLAAMARRSYWLRQRIELTGSHFAIRFGDWRDWRLVVLKDGVRIDDCYEVDLRAGRAWRYRQPLQRCECGEGAEAYIDTGRFAVIRSEGT